MTTLNPTTRAMLTLWAELHEMRAPDCSYTPDPRQGRLAL